MAGDVPPSGSRLAFPGQKRCEDSAWCPPRPAPGARPLGEGARSRPPAVPMRRPGGEAGPCQTPRVLPSQDTQPSRPRVRLLCDRFLDSPWWFWGAWQVFCRTPLRWGLCDVPPRFHWGRGARPRGRYSFVTSPRGRTPPTGRVTEALALITWLRCAVRLSSAK